MPTPDDRPGGIADADKIILNNEGETADNPGEIVWDGTKFVFRDDAGQYDPREGGGTEILRYVTSNTTITGVRMSRNLRIASGIYLRIADGAELLKR